MTNALAESTIGLYKTELIERRRPWRTAEQVELATLEWIDWFDHYRLHGSISDVPPAEFEAAYYRQRAEIPPNDPGTYSTPPVKTPVRASQRLVSEADVEFGPGSTEGRWEGHTTVATAPPGSGGSRAQVQTAEPL